MSKNTGTGTLTINGKERPFHINSTRQTDKFCEVMGIELDEYWEALAKMSKGDSVLNKKYTLVLLYSALYAGAIKQTRRCEFTYDDVVDWVEDADESEATEFTKPLTMLFQMLADAKAALDAKKNADQPTQPEA